MGWVSFCFLSSNFSLASVLCTCFSCILQHVYIEASLSPPNTVFDDNVQHQWLFILYRELCREESL